MGVAHAVIALPFPDGPYSGRFTEWGHYIDTDDVP